MNHNIVYLYVKFSAGAATFEYDAKGRQVMSAYGSGLSTVYNLLDLPQRHTTGDGTVVDYKYAFDGRGVSHSEGLFRWRGSRQYFDRQLGRKSGK